MSAPLTAIDKGLKVRNASETMLRNTSSSKRW